MSPIHHAHYLILKRILDILFSVFLLLLLFPLLVICYLLTLFSLGRPVFFMQPRPGLHGSPFTIIKFRTMRPPRSDEVWFTSDAARLTRIGKLLRKLSLDELPELLNVLRGEMSFVGPRPLLLSYLDKYTPFQRRRHSVKPGITGWAQVNGRQLLTFSQRIELDVWYSSNFSFILDFKILLLTFLVLLNPSSVIPGQALSEVDDLGFSDTPFPKNQ